MNAYFEICTPCQYSIINTHCLLCSIWIKGIYDLCTITNKDNKIIFEEWFQKSFNIYLEYLYKQLSKSLWILSQHLSDHFLARDQTFLKYFTPALYQSNNNVVFGNEFIFLIVHVYNDTSARIEYTFHNNM